MPYSIVGQKKVEACLAYDMDTIGHHYRLAWHSKALFKSYVLCYTSLVLNPKFVWLSYYIPCPVESRLSLKAA